MRRFTVRSAFPAILLGIAGLLLILWNIPAKVWLILLGFALIGAAVCLLK